jgi:hypothetical protein
MALSRYVWLTCEDLSGVAESFALLGDLVWL